MRLTRTGLNYFTFTSTGRRKCCECLTSARLFLPTSSKIPEFGKFGLERTRPLCTRENEKCSMMSCTCSGFRSFSSLAGSGGRRIMALTGGGGVISPTTQEADDDIGALSAGFDRRRTLRRRLSTVSDPPVSPSPAASFQDFLESSIDEEGAVEKPEGVGLQSLLTQLETVIQYRGAKNISHIVVEKEVKELCNAYAYLDESEKLKLFSTIAEKYSVDQDHVDTLAKSLMEATDPNSRLNIQDKLRSALVPKYQWLFSQVGRLEGGVKFLVDFRTDLGEITAKYSESSMPLKTMGASLKDMIGMWFAVGFLSLERVTWQSPCDMLQKISEYESVHPMRNWTDLKRRVGTYRRCFVFTHGSMPGEPVVVLHTALTDHIPSSIASIVVNPKGRMMSVDSNAQLTSGGAEDTRSITAAIFYSITSTQKGLAGIELGNYLIKRVVRELQAEFPKISTFSSLSPIPGFKSYFMSALKAGQENLLTAEEKTSLSALLECSTDEELFKKLNHLVQTNSWIGDEKLVNLLEKPVMRACGVYLVLVKRRGFAMDSVANFHLKNGAVIWRLNWLANTKPKGMSESCGIMVNYRYYLEDCEKNSQEYMETQDIKTSDQVKHLIKSVELFPTGNKSKI